MGLGCRDGCEIAYKEVLGGQREGMIEWIRGHEEFLWYLGVFSAASVVGALFMTPWAISLIGEDYFMRPRERSSGSKSSGIRWLVLIIRNIAGILLVISGIALLALPGQGLLTILTGLVLMSFPGKRAIELGIIRLPMVLRTVNWIRSKRGKEPLKIPPL